MPNRIVLPFFLVCLILPSPTGAVEYRLRVANLQDAAYFHYAEKNGALRDSPFSLDRLRAALDRGEVPSAVFVASRHLVSAQDGTARSFDAVAIRPSSEPRQEGQWQEVRWNGGPGERVVIVVEAPDVHLQEVTGVGLGAAGSGQFRHYVPYSASLLPERTRATRVGLALIDFWEGKSGLWQKLARHMDLGEGIAALVAENRSMVFADWVFLVIDHPPAPTTYDVVIAWRDRERLRATQWEGAGGGADPGSR